MFRTPAWYLRDLERKERAWAAERTQLIATICRLANRPDADPGYTEPAEPPAPAIDDTDLVFVDQLP